MKRSIRALLVDDEQNNLDNLSLLLNAHCPEIEVVGTAVTADGAGQQAALLNPDLVFLDIRMPGQDVFEWLHSLGEPGFEVIFVTAYDQYAIRAIRFSALDYLLKPVRVDELKAAVQKAAARIQGQQQNLLLQNMVELLQHQHERLRHKLALPVNGEVIFVRPGEIRYCAASNTYTTFYLEGGRKVLVSKPIREYEELLAPYGFLRVHQSYLVNKELVRSFSKRDGYSLVLHDGTEVPVARQKREWVERILRNQ